MRDKLASCFAKAWFALILGVLAACQPIQTVTPAPTNTPETPTATFTPTPTIIWFPATNTPTPRPTQLQTPTPESKAGVGDLLYQDDFSDPSAWTTYETANSNVTISNDHITLALNQSEGLIYGFRTTPQLTDFYAELTASPNFCEADDEYGVMVRVNGTRLNHYRFILSCGGQVSITRVVNNRGNVIAEWQSHPLIPSTFPHSSRLAVWAQGSELRFFINDFMLVSVTDTIIKEGTIGVFVRAGGSSPISVNFSDLTVYSLVKDEE